MVGAQDRGFDPVSLEIYWNSLVAIADQAGATLLRTSFSPIVYDSNDYACVLMTANGDSLAENRGSVGSFVGCLPRTMKHFLKVFPHEGWQPGDAVLTNDPWLGTGHLNDFVLTTPCFRQGKPVGLFSCTSHLTDIGGIGVGPDATDVHMEGLYIPMLKLADRGKMDATLMAMIRRNTREPVECEGDVYSLAACNEVGCVRLVEMMDEFGLEDLDTLGEYIVSSSHRAVLAEIAELPKGTYRNAMTVDGYDRPIDLVATLEIGDEGIHVDYDGTSPMSRYGVNVPMAYTTAYTSFGLGCAIAPGVPNNAGSLSAFRVTAPERSILNAPYPAAVCSRHLIGQLLPDVVFGCLEKVVPERVPAEGASSLWNITFRGEAVRGANERTLFAFTAVTNGGTGARGVKDGLNGTAYPSGVKGTPVEIVETMTPVLFRRKELRADSAGPGTWRGGAGQVIEVESASGADMELLAAYERIDHPARGRAGGGGGEAGAVFLASGTRLKGKGTQTIPGGETLVLHTPGGGGHGPSANRPPEAVAADIEDGIVSEAAARRDYGWKGAA